MIEHKVNDALNLLKQNYVNQAIEKFEEILINNTDYCPALNGIGLAYVCKKEFNQAKKFFEKACLLEPENAIYQHYLANTLHQLGDFSGALCHYKKAIEINPNYAEAYNNLGNLYVKHQFIEEASVFYHEAIAIKPDYADAYFNLAQVAMMQEDYRLAKELWEKVLKHCHEPARVKSAQFALGSIAYQSHDYLHAIHYQKLVLALDPDSVDSIRQIAWSYIELNTYQEALFWCDELLDRLPEDAMAHYNKGIVLLRQNNYNQAEVCFKNSILFDVKQVDARINLAMLELKKEKKQAAIHHYQEVLQLQPENEIARYMLSALTGEMSWQSAPKTFVSQLYDSYAEHYEKNMLQQLQYQVPQHFLEILNRSIEPQHKKLVVLDLGCGTGLAGNVLHSFAETLVGVDISPAMLKQAKEKNIYTELFCMPMEKYFKEHDQKFDLIYAADSLLYIGDLTGILHSAAKALKSGGFLIFSTEAPLNGQKHDYQLQSSGRFSHSKSYLLWLAEKLQFKVRLCNSVILRQQKGRDVPGYIVLLQK